MKTKVLHSCLRIAIEHNTPSKHPEWYAYKHFSFVIQQNRIVEWGTNRRGSALTFLGYEPHQKIHSEVDAYFKARGIMTKGIPFEVVNIRLNKSHVLRASNPCRCCYQFLKNLGCKGIFFTTDIGKFARIIF